MPYHQLPCLVTVTVTCNQRHVPTITRNVTVTFVDCCLRRWFLCWLVWARRLGSITCRKPQARVRKFVGLADSCRLLLCKLAGWVGVWGFLLWKGSAVPQLDKVRRPPTALPVCSANGRAGLVPLSSLCWGLKTVREGQRGEENDFLHCPDWTQGGLPCQSAMPTGRAGVLPSSSPRWGLQTATGRGEEGCPD